MRLTYLSVAAAVICLSVASAQAQTDKLRKQMALETAKLLDWTKPCEQNLQQSLHCRI
jgi:hypothetical protein